MVRIQDEFGNFIDIINIDGPDDGVCTYTLSINRLKICTFTHDRREGLAVCLEKAAAAARESETERRQKEWIKLAMEMNKK
jgi:hypothetical protein